jgi:hypothetical protein
MSLIGNVSSRIVNNSLVNSSNQLFNPPANGSAIALFAVAMIVALGVYLLRRFCPCLEFSAKSASLQLPFHPQQNGGLALSQPRIPDSTSSSSSSLHSTNLTSSIPKQRITDPVGVPDSIFSLGEHRGVTHFQQQMAEDGTAIGWNLISEYKDEYVCIVDKNKGISGKFDKAILDAADWISAEDVRRCKRPNVVFDTDPNHVSDYAFELAQSGPLSGTTHYRELQDIRGNRIGWLLINDNEKTAYIAPFNSFLPDIRQPSYQWAFPADQRAWINAEDVRSCKQHLQQPNPKSQQQMDTLHLSPLRTSSEDDSFSSTESEESDHSTEEQPQPELELSSSLDSHSSTTAVDPDSDPDDDSALPEESTGSTSPSTVDEQTVSTNDLASNPNPPELTIVETSSSIPTSAQTSTRIARTRPRSSLGTSRAANQSKFNTLKESERRRSKLDPTLVEEKKSEAAGEQPSTSAQPPSEEQPTSEVVPAVNPPPRRYGNAGGPQPVVNFGAGGVAGALAGLRSTKKNSSEQP